MTAAFDAVVLAGGRSTRMRVADKTSLVVGDRSLLDRVLSAVDGATSTVVVGPPRDLTRMVTWVTEHPPGGGPVAAAAAGLALGTAPYVALLAADLPLLCQQHISRLLAALEADPGSDGVVYVDGTGRPQWLCGVWRREPITRATEVRAGSLHAAVADLRVAHIRDDEATRPAWLDCDTPDDLRRVAGLLA